MFSLCGVQVKDTWNGFGHAWLKSSLLTVISNDLLFNVYSSAMKGKSNFEKWAARHLLKRILTTIHFGKVVITVITEDTWNEDRTLVKAVILYFQSILQVPLIKSEMPLMKQGFIDVHHPNWSSQFFKYNWVLASNKTLNQSLLSRLSLSNQVIWLSFYGHT